MKALLTVFVSLCFVLVYLLLSSDKPSSSVTATVIPEINDRQVWQVVQEWRKSEGLQEYIESDLLCKYADTRVDQIQSDFSHDGYNSNVAASIYQDDQSLTESGENLSMDISAPRGLLHKWLNSPAHKKNLTDPFTDSCVRCKNNKCVQLFAR